MKAIIFNNFKELPVIKEVDTPKPDADGVLIEVKATGLCLSDWHGWMGHDPDITLPHVPGHELAGNIAAIGANVKNLKVGDSVTVPFVCGCGTCPQCKSGNHQVCDHQSQPGFTHWGSFAEYVKIDYADTNLVILPQDIDYTTAAILGCRFITSFRAIVDQGKTQAGQFVVVHGCGGIGLSAIMIASALRAQVVAVDISDSKLEFAKSIGAKLTVNALKQKNIVAHIKELTDGGAHVSVDALGSQETCFNSVSNLRKRGKHIQVGLMTGDHKHPKLPMDQVLAGELEVIGSHGMQAYKYPHIFDMIRNKKLEPRKLIESTITLEEAAKALPRMNEFKNNGVLVVNSF